VRLHQLKVEYVPVQDRLTLLLSTSDQAEIQLWLTRRLVKLLWPLLLKLAADTSPKIQEQANPEAKKALLGFEHEQALSKADFSKPYQAPAPEKRVTPLGQEPILVARVQTGRNPKGQALLALHPAEGQGITLTLDQTLLHAICRLIHAAVQRSDWELTLVLPGTEGQAEAGGDRIVN
jgi:hypothetical protein